MKNEASYFNKFSIRFYRDIPINQWNEFVMKNDMGYIYHCYEMMIIGPEDIENFDNISFAIFDNHINEIVLLMPLYKINHIQAEGVSTYKLISRKGVVIKDGLFCKYKQKLSKYFISQMELIMQKYKVSEFYTELPALAKYSLPDDPQIINPLIYFGFTPSIRYAWVVDLQKDEHRILSDCEETTRQSIRKLSSNDEIIFLETNELTKAKDCLDFIKLSRETFKRSLGNFNEDYCNRIFSQLPFEMYRMYFIRNKLNNEPIAAAVILIFKNTAKYFLGASVKEKPTGINKFLIYCIMLELKRAGVTYFETGSAYPFLRDTSKKKGISDFKKSFGTLLHIGHTGTFYSSDSTLWKNNIKSAIRNFKEKGTISI